MKKTSPKKKKISSFFKKLSPVLTENPVLVSGLSLGPVVAISTSLKAGVSLSAAFLIIVLPIILLNSLLPKFFSKSIRFIVYSFISCIFFVPALMFAKTIFPEVSDKVGIFLPLMVVNPIISSFAENEKNKGRIKRLFEGVKTAAFFAVIMCAISFIREILGKGSIWDKQIANLKGNISFLLPFTGFIIVGLFAALARKIQSDNGSKEGGK